MYQNNYNIYKFKHIGLVFRLFRLPNHKIHLNSFNHNKIMISIKTKILAQAQSIIAYDEIQFKHMTTEDYVNKNTFNGKYVYDKSFKYASAPIGAHFFNIKYLIFQTKNANSIDSTSMSEIELFQYLLLSFSGQIVYEFNIGFLMKLNKPIINSNSICVQVPFEMSVGMLGIHDFYHINYIKSQSENFSNYTISLWFSSYYLDQYDRKRLCINEFPIIKTHPIISGTIEIPPNCTSYTDKLNFNKLARGYFIEGNIDDITELRLDYVHPNYNHIFVCPKYISWSAADLQSKGQRIHPQLLYIDYDYCYNCGSVLGCDHTKPSELTPPDSLKYMLDDSNSDNYILSMGLFDSIAIRVNIKPNPQPVIIKIYSLEHSLFDTRRYNRFYI
jgi:hypothetical protein